MDSPMTGEALLELMRDFARPHKVLGRHEDVVCFKAAEVCWSYQNSKARDLIASSGGRPILFSYGSDGTPLLTRSTTSARLPSARQVRRNAGRAVEFLVERAFLCSTDGSGRPIAVALFKPPTPLDHGKGAWQVFAASCKFLPLLRRLGHEGISVSHYCFDRALFSSLAKKQAQRHALYYETMSGGGERTGALALQELTDWVVSTACANHDAQNALKWCLGNISADPEIVSKMHIAVESLRNGFDLLQGHLVAFIQQKISFVDVDEDQAEVWSFWVNLGVAPDVAEGLADLNLVWRGDGGRGDCGCLLVHERHRGRDDLLEVISGLMLALFRFKRFTDSRWVTVGDCCRTLTAARFVGLEGLVAMTRRDPRASDYYLHGFSMWTEEVKLYAAVAGLSAHVPDAALLSLLEDDRVALKADAIAMAMHEELEWLISVSEFTWRRLSLSLLDITPQWLRSLVLSAGHTACAFFQRRVLLRARSYPWRLVRGDIAANIAQLAEAKDIKEETTAKIQKLARMKYDARSLVAGVRLLGEVSWATIIVEQGHGSSAVLHKAHRMYGASMLASRSMLHMMRCLLPAEDKGSKVQALAARRKSLESRQPERLSGRHIFLRDCVQTASSLRRDGSFSAQDGRDIMRVHSAMYKRLAPEAREGYERQASAESAEKRRRIEDELLDCWLAEKTGRAALTEERLDRSLRLSDCRYTMRDMEAMAALWADPRFSTRKVVALRAEGMEAPKEPSPHAQSQLEDMDVQLPAADPGVVPSWAKPVCAHRDLLTGCALVFNDGGEDRVYALLYAMQSPMLASFLELTPVNDDRELLSLLQAPPCFCRERYDFVYKVQKKYLREVEIPVNDETEAFVLSDMVFVGKGAMASHSVKIPIEAFLHEALRTKRERANQGAIAEEKPALDRTLVERFPWLKAYMAEEGGAEAPGKKGVAVSGPVARGSSAPLTEAEADEVFSLLEARRRLWREEYSAAPEDFVTTILGGAWTKAHLGVEADAIKASARGGAASAWCAKYGLGRQKSFAFKKYGEGAASKLALFWSQRMQFFYTIFKESLNAEYVYTDRDLASAPSFEDAAPLLEGLPAGHPAYESLRQLAALEPGSA